MIRAFVVLDAFEDAAGLLLKPFSVPRLGFLLPVLELGEYPLGFGYLSLLKDENGRCQELEPRLASAASSALRYLSSLATLGAPTIRLAITRTSSSMSGRLIRVILSHVSEWNPLDSYRSISLLKRRYDQTVEDTHDIH